MLIVCLVVSLIICSVSSSGTAVAGPFSGPFASTSDSLTFPGEIFVITADELARYDINTLEDIFKLIPGVSYWQEGTPGARSGFSVDGRTWKGVTLLVNGIPFHDPYNDEHISRFLNLSRLKRIEVVYDSSPTLTGRTSSGSLINVVIEEGGRKPPVTAGDFSWGGNARKSRKAWFSTPDAYISATIAYDEYLQNALEGLSLHPNYLLGKYKSRSVLMDLTLGSGPDGRMLVRVRSFEDAYTGTGNWPERREPAYPPEEVRYSGFDSEIRYVRSRLAVSLRQRMVEMRRKAGWTSGLVFSGSLSWSGTLGSMLVKGYMTGERTTLENRLWDELFDPRVDRAEAGLTGGVKGRGLIWRIGLSGGWMTDIDFFFGGETGLSHGDESGFHQTVMIARRVRTPTPAELYQPVMDRTIDGTELVTSGNAGLGYERSDEISIGGGYGKRVSLDLFARRERGRIVLRGSAPAIYSSAGDDDVIGVRARLGGTGSIHLFGFEYGYALSGAYYLDRAEITHSVPEYSVKLGAWLSRLSFKKTERFVLRLDMAEVGKSLHGQERLGRYFLADVSASITVMGAIVKFEVLNILDEKYETVPGYFMPERHYRFGINWQLFD
jgi:hypothetical protein